MMAGGIFDGLMVWLTLGIGLLLIEYQDAEWQYRLTQKERSRLLMLALGNGQLVAILSQRQNGAGLLLDIVAGCLLTACVTDRASCLVHQFLWWPACGAGLLLLKNSVFWQRERLVELCVFAVIQEVIFGCMYGRADCHAFVACAVAECAFGGDILFFTLHMAVTFLLFAAVQGLHGNIGRGGRLVEAKPLLPYITVGFWGMLIGRLLLGA